MNAEEVKMNNKDKWGIFVPLLLFVAGMSIPFFTDNRYAMLFALLPFYAYSYIASLFGSKNEDLCENIAGTMAFVFVLSAVFAVVHCFVLSDMSSSIAKSTLMGMINVPVSFSSMLILYFGRTFYP